MQKILGIIGWIGTVLVFGAVAIRFLHPDWNQYATYAAWAGLVAVLIYMAGQWRDVAEFYKGRSAKYGTVSIVSVIVFLGILIAVNYLGTRQNKRWDFTANQVYSLSDQTVKLLKDLKEPAKITVFERGMAGISALLLIAEFTYSDTAGVLIAVLLTVANLLRLRSLRATPPQRQRPPPPAPATARRCCWCSTAAAQRTCSTTRDRACRARQRR